MVGLGVVATDVTCWFVVLTTGLSDIELAEIATANTIIIKNKVYY